MFIGHVLCMLTIMFKIYIYIHYHNEQQLYEKGKAGQSFIEYINFKAEKNF